MSQLRLKYVCRQATKGKHLPKGDPIAPHISLGGETSVLQTFRSVPGPWWPWGPSKANIGIITNQITRILVVLLGYWNSSNLT